MTRLTFFVAGVLSVITVSPAFAQGSAFVGGLAGVTFNTETSAAVAGRGGVRIADGLFVIGEVGRMMNVLPADIAEELDEVEDIFEAQIGLPISISAKVPNTYAFGGVRWEAPGEGRFRPFIEGGFGIAHLTGEFDVEVSGLPLPDEFLEEFDQVELSSNEPMFVIGGGVKIDLTPRIAIDAGYRFTKIFVDDDVDFDVPGVQPNLVYAGIVLSFGR